MLNNPLRDKDLFRWHDEHNVLAHPLPVTVALIVDGIFIIASADKSNANDGDYSHILATTPKGNEIEHRYRGMADMLVNDEFVTTGGVDPAVCCRDSITLAVPRACTRK